MDETPAIAGTPVTPTDWKDQLWPFIEKYGMAALSVLIILLVALLIASWVQRMVLRGCEKARLDITLARFFARLARWAILLIAALFCLNKFGIETASFAVVLGSVGLAVGLALQGTLSNFASGVMLLVFRPFKVGDVVAMGGHIGQVDEIDLFTTALNTGDNRRIILPNSGVFGSTIENITHNSTRRADISVGVSYSADLDQTRQVLTEAAGRVPGSLKDPAPQILLLQLGSSSVDWEVRVWCSTDDYWVVRDAATAEVKKALDKAGLSIPFPQLDIHLDAPVARALGGAGVGVANH